MRYPAPDAPYSSALHGNIKKMIVIGVLIRDIDGTFQQPVVSSLLKIADKLGVSLLFFPGNEVATRYAYLEQFNAVYALARSPRVDAILSVTTTFNAQQEAGQIQRMLEQYGKPVVSFGVPFPGIPAIVLDNRTGQAELIDHLIGEHGFRRLAFMRGPLHNADAEQRYQAYRERLAAAGIAYDPDLVVTGNFDHHDGRQAMARLLDGKKPFDAVVAANDEMAMACLSVALERGFHVPEDFAITGFDDLLSIVKSGPPLTTVHQPFSDQAAEALRHLVRHVQGEVIPPLTLLPTHAVFRQSCGCLVNDRHVPAAGPERRSDEELIVAGLNLHQSLLAGYRQYLDQLRICLFSDGHELFNQTLCAIANSVLQDSGDISGLQGLLIGMHRHLLKPELLGSADMAKYAGRLQRGQILLSNALTMQQTREGFVHWSNQRSMAGFLKMKLSNFDQEELAATLHQTLRELEMPTCYVALYDYPVAYKTLFEFTPPETSRLILAHAGYQRRTELEGTPFPTAQLIPSLPDGQQEQRATALGVFPIFQHNQHFGYVILDVLAHARLDAEQIRDEISTSLTGAILVNQLARARDLLRQDLDLAAKQNDRLEFLAEIDELTGLFNRRGFYEHAEPNLKAQHAFPMMVLCADLDGLKQINDTYGHAAGDFAIKSASRLLLDSFRSSDVVCRLGGDEFVVLSMHCQPDEIEHIRDRVYRRFEQFNAASGKPYRVLCSLGYYVIERAGDQSLAEVVERADERLYQEKCRRKNLSAS